MAGFKVDLHNHSLASPDGALTENDYRHMLNSGHLDYIAITDHNTAEFALEMRKKIGPRIIVGEEIRTTKGEIIGLYLKQTIPKLMSPQDTVTAIREQGGLVCIPHPFEDVRRGMSQSDLDTIAEAVDLIEVHNGRAFFQNKSRQAYEWAAKHKVVGVANSDSHAMSGWGQTYSVVASEPNRDNLVSLMAEATLQVGFPGFRAILYPKYNRFKKYAAKRTTWSGRSGKDKA